MSMYRPKPADTLKIELPAEISSLAELLAKNAHDVWAQGRIAEGWSYGEKRDDGKKKHPCLVEYEDLPESEKQYDRNTAMETLKLIISLGYKITR
jgi:hypothetical protein